MCISVRHHITCIFAMHIRVQGRFLILFFWIEKIKRITLLSFFFCFGVLLVYLPTTNKLMKVLDTDLFLIFSLSIYDSKKKRGGKQEVEVRRRDHNDLCESLRCACVCVDLSIEENSKSKKSVSLLLSFTCVRCNGMLCLSACRWV